ncbi:hypothetical protein WJ972_27325 [Achromobacter insuavis]
MRGHAVFAHAPDGRAHAIAPSIDDAENTKKINAARQSALRAP